MRQLKPYSDAPLWAAPGRLYVYQMMPDDPNTSEYTGQTVQESFGSVTAVNFDYSSLDDIWKLNNGFTADANGVLQPPSNLDNINKVAAFLFDSGKNGSFRIDDRDQIQDEHSGATPGVYAFKISSYKGDGFGYSIVQNYTCNNAIVGTCTITRRFKFVSDQSQQVISEVSKTRP